MKTEFPENEQTFSQTLIITPETVEEAKHIVKWLDTIDVMENPRGYTDFLECLDPVTLDAGKDNVFCRTNSVNGYAQSYFDMLKEMTGFEGSIFFSALPTVNSVTGTHIYEAMNFHDGVLDVRGIVTVYDINNAQRFSQDEEYKNHELEQNAKAQLHKNICSDFGSYIHEPEYVPNDRNGRMVRNPNYHSFKHEYKNEAQMNKFWEVLWSKYLLHEQGPNEAQQEILKRIGDMSYQSIVPQPKAYEEFYYLDDNGTIKNYDGKGARANKIGWDEYKTLGKA
ncbi:MAG: hypothetical protein V3V74_07300 [Nitrosomonadaceae bacterium]